MHHAEAPRPRQGRCFEVQRYLFGPGMGAYKIADDAADFYGSQCAAPGTVAIMPFSRFRSDARCRLCMQPGPRAKDLPSGTPFASMWETMIADHGRRGAP